MLKHNQTRFFPYTYPALRIEIPDAPAVPSVPMMPPYYNPVWLPPPFQQNPGIANLQKLNLPYIQTAYQDPKTLSMPVANRQQGTTKLKDFYIDSILKLNKSETVPVTSNYKPSWDGYNVNPMHYCGYNTIPRIDNVQTKAVSPTLKVFGEETEIARREDSDVDSVIASSPTSTSSNLEEFSATFPFEDSTSPEQYQKPKRARTTFTSDQMQVLEARFSIQQYMVGEERIQLAKSLNLKESQVKIWFQNRRIKWRKQNLGRLYKKPLTGLKKMKRFYFDFKDTRSV